jgi:hypothetical protein
MRNVPQVISLKRLELWHFKEFSSSKYFDVFIFNLLENYLYVDLIGYRPTWTLF